MRHSSPRPGACTRSRMSSVTGALSCSAAVARCPRRSRVSGRARSPRSATSLCWPPMPKTLADRVAEKIAEMRPYLERSGGHAELVDVEDGIARIRVALTRPRPSRLVVSLQLKSGIERLLRNAIPELRGVEAINLPPYAQLGWDQPDFVPVDLPVKTEEDGSKP